ncbi:MAG: PTS galactitol transporter subunit IIC [Anaerolineae bacterium]|nr:PTS galactitol transporter subunit IIC [Anaerolineae bacterium]
METFVAFLKSITALPTAVMLPLAILILSLIAGMKFGKAFRASVLIGIGLVGLFAMIGVFGSTIGPVVAGFVANTGIQLDVSDLGVFTLLTATWGSPIAIWFIPVGLLVNLLFLALKLTKTLDADILNYWTWGITAVVVYTLTGSVWLALLFFALNEILILFIADRTAPIVAEHYGIEGTSVPHGNAGLWPPVGIAMNWVIEKIPGLNKLDADPETIQKKFGVVGDPIFIGVVLGAILGIAGKQPWGSVLNTAVTLAAVMIIFPRMLNIMMEGLRPISEQVRDFMKKRFNRDVYIGLDAAILIGFPENLAAGILLIPIIIALALILPGNRVIPLADLAIAGPFLVCLVSPFCKRGNIVRTLIAGTVVFIIALYTAGDLAPVYTEAGKTIGMNIPEGTVWTSIGAGSHWFAWIVAKILGLFGYVL